MEQKLNIFNLTKQELEAFVIEAGEKKYRAAQIMSWIYNGVLDTDEMTNLSKPLKDSMKNLLIGELKLLKKQVSKTDNTKKYLFGLNSGDAVESVLMKYKYGYSACISSQIGCKMGCSFCSSADQGFKGNLSSGQMIEQIVRMSRDEGERIGNIVIMGIGEPLDNYDNVISFIKQCNSPDCLNIGYRHITVSTCGLVPEIIKLSKEKIPINLSVSLHAADEITRGKIMPINKKYSIDNLIEACKIYTLETRRRLTFEYILLSGVNDTKKHAQDLAKKIRHMLCHVNLIEYNETNCSDNFKKSDSRTIKEFKKVLDLNGISTTLRRKLGSDVEAACGQLRRKNEKAGE